MALGQGDRLGSYEILGPLGSGGMGEVYRARDTKLHRDVAIKILPPVFTTDPDRLTRFEREARVLAALNHPHIGAIYGFEESDAIRALVLELVEGDTLAERIRGGAIPLGEVLTIARQIAEALDAAHEKGIVHRDLKPANIKITPDGIAKVLDFGLAKAVSRQPSVADLAESPTLTVSGTREGIILGTAAYMSPEQARGQTVDKRADIWAFGCVLYEMVTGRAAFARETMTDTLAAIVNSEPNWRALPADTPAGLDRLLTHCLEKDPKRRLRDIGDARVELEGRSAAVLPVAQRPGRARIMDLLTAATVGLVVGALGFYLLKTYPSARPARDGIARFTFTLDAPDWFGLERPTLAFSPDGSRFVYLERNDAGPRLYLRAIDQFDSRPLSGSNNAANPFFAPDGESVGFFAESKLKTLSLRGGTPTDVCALPAAPLGASWSSTGSIVLGSMNSSTLRQVPASGGTPQPVGQPKDVHDAEAWPDVLPDGKSVLFTRLPIGDRPAFVAVASLVTGERKYLIEGSSGHYVSTGYLVYMLGESLMGVRFDPNRLEVVGTPVALLDKVQQAERVGAAQFSVSNTGNLVYFSGAGGSQITHLVLVDRLGQSEQIAPPARVYAVPRVSPDGERIVVATEENQAYDVWVYDIRRSSWNQLTFDRKSNVPIWTPDGKRVTFIGTTDGTPKLYSKAADGSGSVELLSNEPGNPHSWSPDGRWLARTIGGVQRPVEIGLLSIDGNRKTQPFVSTIEGTEMAAPAFSPDGRWIAYVANDSGRRRIYVRAFPAGEGRWLVSSEGGTQPMWARDGRELFYRDGDKMMAVGVALSPVFRPEKPRMLFEGRYEGTAVRSNYDVMPDGRHFVMVKADEKQVTSRQLNIIVNWSTDLKRRLPSD